MASDTETEKKETVDWAAALAGAGSAVTVAVLLSTLGAAGTLIGAALGSVVATIATALYKNGIRASKRQMAAVQAAALHKVGRAQDDVRRAAERAEQDPAAADLARAEINLQGAADHLEAEEGEQDAESPEAEQEPADGTTTGWRALPWRRIAIGSVGIFLIAMLVISVFELIAGESVSSLTGGSDSGQRTSIGGVVGNDDRSDDQGPGRDRERDQGGSEEPTDQATRETEPTTPTNEATEAPSETTSPTSPTSPSSEPTETDTASPFEGGSTGAPEATPTP